MGTEQFGNQEEGEKGPGKGSKEMGRQLVWAQG